MRVTRKTFLQASLAATAALVGVACGDDEDGGGSTTGNSGGSGNAGGAGNSGNSGGAGNSGNSGGMASGDCEANGTSVMINGNHGHTLMVSAADVQDGTEKTYMIMGTSPHDHSVTVTADDFTALQAGDSVQVTSTTGGGHTHSITITCA